MGRALLMSCHPIPALAVTLIATVLAAVAGNSAVVCVLVAGAMLTGQLSIGWSNDLIDARRDAASGRTEPFAATCRIGAGFGQGLAVLFRWRPGARTIDGDNGRALPWILVHSARLFRDRGRDVRRLAALELAGTGAAGSVGLRQPSDTSANPAAAFCNRYDAGHGRGNAIDRTGCA